MFLAIKEMRYAKLRYGLIIGIMFLIAYVVFMLSGLATGLSWQFKQAIVDWQAETIVLSEDANQAFAASQLTRQDLTGVKGADKGADKAPIGLYSAGIKGDGEQVNVSVFGTDTDAFILPKVTEGQMFKENGEVIISQNLADKGYEIGDLVKIGKSDEKVKIVGIFPETFYSVTPVIYTSLDSLTALKYPGQVFASEEEQPLNIVAVKESQVELTNDATTKLEQMKVADFIEKLPGYSAQNLTLNAMIYFLFVIVAAIVGIFMYVMTLQKTAIFGVMKAQGISNRFIASSIVGQAFIVGLVGVIIAVAAAYGTSFILPEVMPFSIDWQLWSIYSGILLVVAIIGGLFSIRTVAKVNPISAIGG
ncbi:ABC transporter permease [Enterococcus sp. JM4C]|uniref:ABC transporter permease n=1 Tax=Candidatus Enterococcus huntleyi TaxID=1857217 RepID=UPI00137A246D|nr:ABC transporter permease [Enterococcus sp. JM4C]KAF1299117.1 ABC transporter permease [Enterococcus sp. JM4C]